MANASAVTRNWLASSHWLPFIGQCLLAAAVVGASFLAARVAVRAFQRVRGHSRTGRSAIYVVEKLVSYGVVVAGLFVGLSVLGVNLTSLTVFLGAVGIGIGLGLQSLVREFVSGLLIIFDPSIQINDFVEIETGIRGEVVEVGLRATLIRTNDGLNAIVPNSKMIENQVINWTYSGGTRRMHIPFSVAYGVDKALVRKVVLNAAHEVAFTMPDTDTRKTQVWMTEFGSSALNFELVVWPTFDAVKRPAAMRAAYTWAIEDALRKAGIEMPFPQLDLRLRSLFGREERAALRAMGMDSEAPESRQHTPAESYNDAAEALVADAEEETKARAARQGD